MPSLWTKMFTRFASNLRRILHRRVANSAHAADRVRGDRNVKILIVEDDWSTSRVLRMALSSVGHYVHIACDGMEGLLEVDRGVPDLILTDLNMPSMNGLAFCKRVRARSKTPIIVLSAEASPAAMVEALDAGADDYVAKPFSMPELQARIRGFVRRSQIRE